MKYRGDLDGLRAVAVLAILVFHVNPGRLAGGYVGVDVFFVLSGFLIAGLILRDLEKGTFSFRDFYLRRVRRLFPALFVMLLVAGVAATILLLPPELERFGWGAGASVVYLSNFYFWTISGYFDTAAEFHPLLHTWSLSVEEQFYLIFPALLFFAFARGGRRLAFAVAVVGGLISFGLCQLVQSYDSSLAFYLSPTRFWEFMLGAALALSRPTPGKALRQFFGVAGILLVAAAVVSFNSATSFPGYAALAPAVGTALLLLAGMDGGSWTSRFLTLPPLRWIGRASYSIYLWHWPLIVFFKITFGSEMSLPDEVLLTVASVLLGAASYYFVERPTRGMAVSFRSFGIGATAATAVVCMVSGLFIATRGLEGRFRPEVTSYAAYLNFDPKPSNRVGDCFITSASANADSFRDDLCIHTSGTMRRVLVIGDSHAAHLYPGLANVFADWAISQITASGCKPVLMPKGEQRCTSLMRRAFQTIVPAAGFDEIVLAARWSARDVEPAIETARYLSKFAKRVEVVGPIPTYKLPLPRLLALAAINGDQSIVRNAQEADTEKDIDIEFRRALAGDPQIGFVSLVDALCQGNPPLCRTTASDGRPLQYDYGHLTDYGSIEVMSAIAHQIRP